MHGAAQKPGKLCIALILLLMPAITLAVDYTVNTSSDTTSGTGTSGSLPYIIGALNTGGGATNNIFFNTTAINGTISLNSVNLPVLTRQATLSTTNPLQSTQIISGNGNSRLLGTTSSMSMSNISLQNGLAQGGGGGNNAGGGGLGAGGGIFISGGSTPVTVTLTNSSITGCSAIGGAGGNGLLTGGNGGAASFGSLSVITGAGYGGGVGGTGYNGSNLPGGAGGGTGAGSAGGNNGVGGAGGYCGGGGGAGNTFNGGTLFGGGAGGNGGGAAGGAGAGAGGGYGAGGAGASVNGAGAGGGGFGGGGGGSPSVVGTGSATNSNYSGGSGAPTFQGTVASGGGGGGFGAGGGGGGTGSAGGGGSGLGGGVFVGDGATLIINDTSGTATNISGNSGVGGGSATSVAPGVFLFKGASIQFTSAIDTPVNFSIQCDPGATGVNKDSGVIVNLANSALTLTLNTPSSGSNNFQGPFTITRGILSSTGANLPGTSVSTPGTISLNANSRFDLTAGAFPTNTVINNTLSTINLAGSFAPAVTSTSTGTININADGSFTPPAGLTYSGTVNVNTGNTPLGGTLTGTATSTLNIGNTGTITYTGTVPAIVNVNTINIQNASNFTTSNNISGVTTAFTTSAGSRTTLNAIVSGTGGVFTNSGTLILNTNNAVATTGAFTNTATTGAIYSSATFTPSTFASFTNNSSVNIYGPTGAISGNFNPIGGANSSLNFGRDVNATLYDNTYTMTGTITNTPSIRVFAGTLNTNGNGVSGVSTGFTVDSGAAATISGTYSGSGAVNNSGTLTIGNTFGTAAVTNLANATLLLASGANTISSNITNNANAQLTVNSAATVNTANSITNNGTMNVNAALAAGAISNTNMLTIAGNMSLGAQNLTNTGTITVSGQRNLTANSLIGTSVNTMNFSIPSANQNQDRLSITGSANISNSTINVSASPSLSGSWVIVSTTGTLTAPPASNIILPVSGGQTIFGGWRADISSNSITIVSGAISMSSLATGQFNSEVANVLQQMSDNITNSGQKALINAFLASSSQAEYNDNLHQMFPNINSGTQNVLIQNSLFKIVQNRNTARREDVDPEVFGISSGEINASTGLWVGGFGSIAKQKAHEMNEGYRANALGSIVGIDTRLDSGGFVGAAFAVSNSNIYEESNSHYNSRILGYHGLIYGSSIFDGDYFLEWLLTGVSNKNHGSRPIHLNGQNYAVTSDYWNYMGGGNFSFGKFIDLNEYFRLTQIYLAQYLFIYDPSYTEYGSVAALNISNTINRNILTGGTGIRLSLPGEDPWFTGNREIYALATYDAINAKNVTTANFVVGSNNFTITDNPNRIAFIAGVNYSLVLSKCTYLQFTYNYTWRNGYYNNSGAIKFKLVF